MAYFGFNLVLVVSVVLIFFTTTGYSLICYDCTSSVGESCGNDTFFNKANVATQNCTLSNQVCGLSVEVEAGFNTKIRRSCVNADYCSVRNNTLLVPSCRVCKGNLCNSSYNVVPSFGIITFLVLCFSCLYFNIHT